MTCGKILLPVPEAARWCLAAPSSAGGSWRLKTCTRTSSRTAHNCANDICSIEIDHVGYVRSRHGNRHAWDQVWPDVCVYAKVPVPLAPETEVMLMLVGSIA